MKRGGFGRLFLFFKSTCGQMYDGWDELGRVPETGRAPDYRQEAHT